MGIYFVNKQSGETPLACLERFRAENALPPKEKITYAGRLDPLASGVLVLLTGSDVHRKEEFLNKDKIYECEILFGVATDTADALGLIVNSDTRNIEQEITKLDIQQFVGTHNWHYPVYSSKTILGKPLFSYAREGSLVDIPKRAMTIKNIEILEEREYSIENLVQEICARIDEVLGDFRQEECKSGWRKFEQENPGIVLRSISIRVQVSSGTYMRVLAEKIGESLNTPALALRIKRTEICEIKK